MKIAIVVSSFNEEVTSGLKKGALDYLTQQGIKVSEADIYPAPGAFEFSESQNKVFGKTSVWITALAGFTFLNAVGQLVAKDPSIFTAICYFVIGFLLLSAASSFRKIVTTQGSDVPNLMAALNTFSSVLLGRIIGLVVVMFLFTLLAVALIASS